MNDNKYSAKTIIIVCVLNIVAYIVTAYWNDNRDQVKNAASIKYVDQQDKILKDEVDKKASKDEMTLILSQLKSIESNQIVIQNNQTSLYQTLIQQRNK